MIYDIGCCWLSFQLILISLWIAVIFHYVAYDYWDRMTEEGKIKNAGSKDVVVCWSFCNSPAVGVFNFQKDHTK